MRNLIGQIMVKLDAIFKIIQTKSFNDHFSNSNVAELISCFLFVY